jgi:uncharacterized protein (TIGR02677 family)
MLAARMASERAQIDAARALLSTGRPMRLSELGVLDADAFRLFLNLLGEALVVQDRPGAEVNCQSADGLLQISLTPLEADSVARIETEFGTFTGRDHLLTVTALGGQHGQA